MNGKKKMAIGLLLVLLVVAGVAWVERIPLQSWYYLHGLSRASEAERDGWIEHVVGLGEPTVEGLLDCLVGEDDLACQNAALALGHLGRAWGSGDPRVADLASREARLYGRLSPASLALVLRGMAGWFSDTPPADGVVGACARLLADAATSSDTETQMAGLELAEVLVHQSRDAEVLQPAREMARAGLRSPEAANRLCTVRLGLQPGMDLLESVVGLLRDPAAEVRQAAILAVGPANQSVPDEGLLPSLHDSDPDVRRLAESALRGRGLQPKHIELGRLLTHPNHQTRLQVPRPPAQGPPTSTPGYGCAD